MAWETRNRKRGFHIGSGMPCEDHESHPAQWLQTWQQVWNTKMALFIHFTNFDMLHAKKITLGVLSSSVYWLAMCSWDLEMLAGTRFSGVSFLTSQSHGQNAMLRIQLFGWRRPSDLGGISNLWPTPILQLEVAWNSWALSVHELLPQAVLDWKQDARIWNVKNLPSSAAFLVFFDLESSSFFLICFFMF